MDNHSLIEELNNTTEFRDVDKTVIETLFNSAEVINVQGGEILYHPGKAFNNCVYLPLDTEIQLSSPSGNEETRLPGQFTGLRAALDHSPYEVTAIVSSRGNVMKIGEETLQKLEQTHPDFAALLDHQIADQLRHRQRENRPLGKLAQPVYTIMKSPVAQCGSDTTLKEAFELMQSRKIGSLVVKDGKKLYGMLTFAGIADHLINRNGNQDDTVSGMACEMPVTLNTTDPIWLAEDTLRRHAVKYLLIMRDQKPVGMVSQTDIVNLSSVREGTLVGLASAAENMMDLKDLARRLPEFAAEIQENHHRASDAVRCFSEVQLALQRRTIELAIKELEANGDYQPSVPFAFIIMGSGGRKEMLLGADQDNGIIYSVPDDPADLDWLERLAEKVNIYLDELGFILCPGDIMARNPAYRKSLSAWKNQIEHIIRSPSEKAGIWSNIFFDFITLYGDEKLVGKLRHHILKNLKQRPLLLRKMAEKDAEGTPAIGFFDRLVTHKTKQGEFIDIKRNGLRLIADAARIFALRSGIGATNTFDRLRALGRLGILDHSLVQMVSDAYEVLLDLTLTHQIKQYEEGHAPDKLIGVDELTPASREALRIAMRAIKKFQAELHGAFDVDIF